MEKRYLITALLTSLLLLVSTAHSAPVVLDFEGYANGLIIDDEYDAAYGVNISAENRSTGPDYAVIFDSRRFLPSGALNTPNTSADPDLIAPFDSYNPALQDNYSPGNILIVQENFAGCDGIICTRPDDEGDRPAGIISIVFDNVIELLSIDFFDIENAENGTHPDNRIRLFSDTAGAAPGDTSVNEISPNTFYTPDVSGPNGVGDNLWDQVLFGDNGQGISGIRRIDVYMRGSGAIDNITYSVVPVPSSVWLFGSALIGFIGYSRRRII